MQVLVNVAILLSVLVNHMVSAGDDLAVEVMYLSESRVRSMVVELSESLIKEITLISGKENRQNYSIEYSSLLKVLRDKEINTGRIRIESMQRGKTLYSTWELVKSIKIVSPIVFTDRIQVQPEGNTTPYNILDAKVKVVEGTEEPCYWAQVPCGLYVWEEKYISAMKQCKHEGVNGIQLGNQDPVLYIIFG